MLGSVRVRLPVGRPRTSPARSPRIRPTHPAATAPTCANATSRQSSRRRRTRPPTEEEGREGRPAHQPRRRSLQGTEHRRAPDQQTEGLARNRHPLRQETRELPRRPPPPRRNDLDRRPPEGRRLITTPACSAQGSCRCRACVRNELRRMSADYTAGGPGVRASHCWNSRCRNW